MRSGLATTAVKLTYCCIETLILTVLGHFCTNLLNNA